MGYLKPVFSINTKSFLMRNKLIYWLVPVWMFAACNGNDRETSTYDIANADSVFFPGSISLKDSSRKRMITASMKCRVDNVLTAISELERLANKTGGVIVESRLENELRDFDELSDGSDSLRKVQVYTPTASITVKVPVLYLDTLLNNMRTLAQFIQYRTVKQQDITYQYLSNVYKNKRTESNAQTGLSSKNTGIEIIKYRNDQRENIINRYTENRQLLDDVEHATINFQLFQADQVDVSTVVNPVKLTRTGFGTALLSSFNQGVELFRALILLFVRLWPLWALAILCWGTYYRLSKKQVSKNSSST